MALSDYYFNEAIADAVCDWFPERLKLTGGDYAGQPFRLLGWHRKVLRELYGWRHVKDPSRRRYNWLYCEVAKKNTKSTLCSGMVNLEMDLFKKPEKQVYSSAVDKKQANIVFRATKAMIQTSPQLKDKFKVYQNHIEGPLGQIFRPLSSEPDSADGIDASVIIMDEIHRWKRKMFEVLQYACSAQKDSLIAMITTCGDGNDIDSIWADMRARAKAAIADPASDETFLGVIYSAEDRKDEWENPEVWKLANPAMEEGIIDMVKFRAEVEDAKRNHRSRNNFLRLRLGIPSATDEKAYDVGIWNACAGTLDEDLLLTLPCYLAFDLSTRHDYTCLVAVWFEELDGGAWRKYMRFWYWLPKRAIRDHEMEYRTPMRHWMESGYFAIAGDDEVRFDGLKAKVLELWGRYQCVVCGYDPHAAQILAGDLERDGVEVVSVPQGIKPLNEATKQFDLDMMNGHIVHEGHPVMAWQIANAELRRDTHIGGDNEKIVRRGNDGPSVDGPICAIMANFLAIQQPPASRVSVYETEDLFVI